MSTTPPNFKVRLRYATVKTTSIANSTRFYEQLLGLARTRTEDDFVQLDAGGAELCIDLDDGGELQPQLIFAVDDLPALATALNDHGIETIAKSDDDTWIIVRDPDGNEIVFER